MILKGRKKLVSEYTSEQLQNDQTGEILENIINTSMNAHQENRAEIKYLQEYARGNQSILYKEKEIRPEINNTLVINHAQMTTRTVNGYFLGTPIQYTQNGDGVNKKEEIDYLNQVVSYEDKGSVDKEIGDMQSICGVGYRIIYTDGQYDDEVPFENKSLDPLNTFVVYENTIAEKPLVGVTYLNIYDEDGDVVGIKMYVYTSFGLFTIKTDSELSAFGSFIDSTSEIEFTQYDVGGIPIIEYPNNYWRIGDWELCIGLMDAINSLQSGRLDDIDQTVQSLIVFINAELDEDRYDEMRSAGVISLVNQKGTTSDAKILDNSLDQTGLNLMATELEQLLYAILGIPDRNNRSGGGGDTGQAVELRDGWADLEIVARNKELPFKKAEKQALKILIKILNNTQNMDLSLLDVDIKFSRNKNNNLLVKVQGYSELLATKTLTPSDCLTIVDLVSDVNEYISRGESFWGESFANKVTESEDIVVETDDSVANDDVEPET